MIIYDDLALEAWTQSQPKIEFAGQKTERETHRAKRKRKEKTKAERKREIKREKDRKEIKN